MEIVQAIIIAIIEGITEFLPCFVHRPHDFGLITYGHQ
jgi:hypothetical protein